MKTLIGVVTWTKLDKNEERIAWISPLVEVTGSCWEEVVDPAQEFPARGILFWPRATTAVKGALIHFRAKENSFPKEGGEDYMVVDPLPAFEAVDLRAVGTCEQVRIALSRGIQIPGLPNSRMLVWCRDNLVVGPVALVTGPNGFTSLEKGNRARISCFQIKDGDIRRIEYEGIEHSVVAKPTLGPPHSYVDWDEDEQAIKRAIQYAVTKSSRGSIDFPKQLIGPRRGTLLGRLGSKAESSGPEIVGAILLVIRGTIAKPLVPRSEQSKSGIGKGLFIDVPSRINLIDMRYQSSLLTRIAEM